jgi:hypothetical protein
MRRWRDTDALKSAPTTVDSQGGALWMRVTSIGRRAALALTALAGAAVVVTALVVRDGGDTARAGSLSWRPAPVREDGVSVVASAGPRGFVLHTANGGVDFLPGVNLGATTPGHQPGELAITAAHYRRWFAQMGALGIRAVRIYTIHPPAFYDELVRYNGAHADAPLYLVQGVYLPDETYPERPLGLYDPAVDRAFDHELADAVAAVHGTLTRAPHRGRASGRWRADVSPWLAAWILGVEWDPFGVQRTDRANRGAPAVRGHYFRSTEEATPTERWLARHLDRVATLEHAHGVSMPVAFANWPTTDPLAHPSEPLEREDLVGVDANHVLPTRAWPGGTFASYHAYPYYPDFQRHEPALQRYRLNGHVDPYAGYLAALRDHHRAMPTMVTEFGVPSSIGSAHHGPLGRNQGGHTEQEAMRIDADLLRLIRRQRLAGGFLFSWADEWFKFTWNTLPRHAPVADRRQLWHDAWTNEQWFGLLATDAGVPFPTGRVVHESRAEVREIRLATDPAWLHLRIHLDHPAAGALRLGFDVVPGGAAHLPGSTGRDGASDYAVVLDVDRGTGQAYVRSALDPLQLDLFPLPAGVTRSRDGWNEMLLSTNRQLTIPTTGRHLPYETMNAGALRRGNWNPASPAFDSLATWRVDGKDVWLRVPWLQLGIVDPSSHRALVPIAEAGVPVATAVPAPSVGLRVDPSRGASATATLRWDGWNAVHATERLKAGHDAVARAFRDVADPRPSA